MKLLHFDVRIHALIIIAYLQTLFQLNFAIINSLCTSEECKTLADVFAKNMNPQGDPCTNFYDYACRGWAAQNPKPRDKGLWDVHQAMIHRTLGHVKKMLEVTEISQPAYEQVKALYRSCMKFSSLGTANSARIKYIVSSIGNWPMFPSSVHQDSQSHWQYIENQYINIAGESSFFQYYLTGARKNGFEMRLVVTRPRSPYGMIKRLSTWFDPNERNQYKKFLAQIIDSVAPYAIRNIRNVIDQDLDDVIVFREKLRKVLHGSNSNTDTATVAKTQEWYNAVVPQEFTSKINWFELIRAMYTSSKDSNGITIGQSNIIMEPDYVTNLGILLSTTPERVIANHIHIYFVERHLDLTYDMQVAMFNSYMNDKTGIYRVEPERWQLCLEDNTTALSLRKMYIDTYFTPTVAKAATEMLEAARKTLIEQITESRWVDQSLKNKWINKIQNTQAQQGFPLWYLDQYKGEPRHTYDIDPLVPNMQYLHDINRIEVSAAQYQWPFFSLYLPYVIRYGTTLPGLAHEFYHALDYRNLINDISSMTGPSAQYMYDEINERTQCFKEHYDYYKNEYIKSHGLRPPVLTNTTSEDMPDVMGLKLAYLMYKREKAENNGMCSILPGFEKVGCDKLFFIAYANSYCAAANPLVETDLASTDIHSLPEIRVNVVLANTKEFADTFHCQYGSPYALQSTCDLWK